MPYCQDLQSKMQEAQGWLEQARELLDEYKEIGDEAILDKVDQKRERIDDLREIFGSEEYEQAVKGLVSEKYKDEFGQAYNTTQEEFLENMVIDPSDGKYILDGHLLLENISEHSSNAPDGPRVNFSLLKEVRGTLNLDRSSHFTFPGLEKIDGNLQFYLSEGISLPKLQEVEGKLSFIESINLELPQVQKVGELRLSTAENINLESLWLIDGMFQSSGSIEDVNMKDDFQVKEDVVMNRSGIEVANWQIDGSIEIKEVTDEQIEKVKELARDGKIGGQVRIWDDSAGTYKPIDIS